MTSLSESEMADFQDTFLLFDRKGDGKIETSQIGEVLRALNLNPTEAEVGKYQAEIGGKDQDKRIPFNEFLPVYQALSKAKAQIMPEDIIEGLKVFDKEGNGLINSAELRHILTSLGERLKDEEVEQLFQGNEDQHGNINYEELIRMVMSG